MKAFKLYACAFLDASEAQMSAILLPGICREDVTDLAPKYAPNGAVFVEVSEIKIVNTDKWQLDLPAQPAPPPVPANAPTSEATAT